MQGGNASLCQTEWVIIRPKQDGRDGAKEGKKEWEKATLRENMCVWDVLLHEWIDEVISVCVYVSLDAWRCVCVRPYPYSPWVRERGRSLVDDWARLGGGQGLLSGQAAARAHHGAMGLRVLQRMGLGMVQRRLGMWVLELKLGFELVLVHTGRPIMGKRLWGEAEATNSWDHFERRGHSSAFNLRVLLWSEVILRAYVCFGVCLSSCFICSGECDRLVCLSLQQVRCLQSPNSVWLLLSQVSVKTQTWQTWPTPSDNEGQVCVCLTTAKDEKNAF